MLRTCFYRLFFVFLMLVSCCVATNAQEYFDITSTQPIRLTGPGLEVATVSSRQFSKNGFNTAVFNVDSSFKKEIPPEKVPDVFITRFRVKNPADTVAGTYFFPGFYASSIRLYRVYGDSLIRLPVNRPAIRDSLGYHYFDVAPHDTATIVAVVKFIKTYTNKLHPRLVSPLVIDSFNTQMNHVQNDLEVVTFVFCGLLLMMILYSWATYVQGGNREFLYYSGYAFFLGFMLFTKMLYNHQANRTGYFLESYLDFILQGLGIMCYMFFMKKFLDTRHHFRFLHKLYNYGIGLLAIALVTFSVFHFFSSDYGTQYSIETLTKILLLVMMVIFIVHTAKKWNDRLLRYLILGNLALFVFSMISQAIIIVNPNFRQLPDLFNASLFYYEAGLVLELVFFLMALSYKNKRQIITETRERERLKAENQMKEYEKELAVYKAQQEERNRISADMHDELGAGMTAIRLMSEIAKNKMKEDTPNEIAKISTSANDLLNKMNAIIWSMNSGNDTLDNLISYIRAYSLEYFDGTSITCNVHAPHTVEARELTGDKRRNIFLCVKETLNNVMKHSKATQVVINMNTNGALHINIRDNGIGVDMNNLREFGNGLHNISKRMKSIGGEFSIVNDSGTVTDLKLPL